MSHDSRWNVTTLALYALMIGGIFASLIIVRARTLDSMSGEQPRSDWQLWRSAAQRQAESPGPVSRRTPQAQEPPSLLLLRDHFFICLALAVLLSSVLFFAFAFMVRGVILAPRFSPHPDADSGPTASGSQANESL